MKKVLMITFILQIGKLSLRNVKWVAQDPVGRKWWSQNLTPGGPFLEAMSQPLHSPLLLGAVGSALPVLVTSLGAWAPCWAQSNTQSENDLVEMELNVKRYWLWVKSFTWETSRTAVLRQLWVMSWRHLRTEQVLGGRYRLVGLCRFLSPRGFSVRLIPRTVGWKRDAYDKSEHGTKGDRNHALGLMFILWAGQPYTAIY